MPSYRKHFKETARVISERNRRLQDAAAKGDLEYIDELMAQGHYEAATAHMLRLQIGRGE